MSWRQRAKDFGFFAYLFTCMAWYLTTAGMFWGIADLPILLAALKFGSGLIFSVGLMLFALEVRSRWWLVAVCLLLGAEGFESWWFHKLHIEMLEKEYLTWQVKPFVSVTTKLVFLSPGLLMNLLVCRKPTPESNTNECDNAMA